MKRVLLLTCAAMGLAASASVAGMFCCNRGIHCMVPEPSCPDCSCPCDEGHHRCSARKTENAQKLIAQLSDCCCCERIEAAKKLGCRTHVDFCCNHEVLDALVHALQCDTCWEVRKTAAWSIAYQNARVPQGVLALYLASKLDPHYLVRDAASDALDVLLVGGRRACFKDLLASADELAKALKGKYKPTSGECINLIADFCAQHGLPCAATSLADNSGMGSSIWAQPRSSVTDAPIEIVPPKAPRMEEAGAAARPSTHTQREKLPVQKTAP